MHKYSDTPKGTPILSAPDPPAIPTAAELEALRIELRSVKDVLYTLLVLLHTDTQLNPVAARALIRALDTDADRELVDRRGAG
jgi:hypothetical protein